MMLSVPPAANTLPLVSSVAVCSDLVTFIGPGVSAHVFAAGSYSRAAPLPTTSTVPFERSVAVAPSHKRKATVLSELQLLLVGSYRSAPPWHADAWSPPITSTLPFCRVTATGPRRRKPIDPAELHPPLAALY